MSKSRSQSKTKSGVSALTSMVRYGTNQVVTAAKHRYTGKQAPKNIANDIKTIMSLMNTENKQIYTLANAQAVNWSNSLVYGIGTVAQGSASNQRTGDSIKINRIQLILQFSYSTGTVATTAIQDQTFNWYLVRYKKTVTGSGTTAFNISEFLNQDSNSLYTPMSFPNPDTNEDFQVMANGQVRIDLHFNSTAITVASRVVEIDHACSFHQDYSGSAATTITDNMCFMVFTGLNNINAGGVSNVAVQSSMWYIDN